VSHFQGLAPVASLLKRDILYKFTAADNISTGHVQVTTWSGPPSTWPMMSSFSLTADGVSFDHPTTEHALSHKHRTVSATETFSVA